VFIDIFTKEANMGSAKKEMTMEGVPTGGELMANRKQNHMWWTVAVLLITLWLPGLLGGYTVAGVTQILLSLALVVVLFRIIQGRRPA
jgi:hypothetical protein